MTFEEIKGLDPERFLALVGSTIGKRNERHIEACCPFHVDEHPSMHWDLKSDGSWVWTCRVCKIGGSIIDLEIRRLGLTNDRSGKARTMESIHELLSLPNDALPAPAQRKRNVSLPPWKKPIERVHRYHAADGSALFEVVIHGRDADGCKDMSQRRIDPESPYGHHWDLSGIPRPLPLYRLPEILQSAPGAPVWIVEGEKDADTLAERGLLATCNPGGAGKWDVEHSKVLEGRPVIIVPDNDKPGRDHAQAVSTSLHYLARSICVVDWSEVWPGMPEKADVTDALEIGLTLEEIEAAAKPWKQPALPTAVTDRDAVNLTVQPFNDVGNAERLAAVHWADLRYVSAWGKWLFWDGVHWAPDETGEVHRRMMALSRELQRQAAGLENLRDRENTTKWSLRMGNARDIDNALAVAGKLKGIATHSRELDNDSFLLGVQNGIVNLRTGEFRESMREDLITKCAGAAFDPNAACPIWENFLRSVMGGDETLIRFLQQAVGYSLTGETTEQCLFFCFGFGRNGKTTFLEAVASLCGEYGQGAPESLFVRSARGDQATNDMAALCGARLSYGVELEEGVALAESRIKRLTGGDSLTARFLHKEFFTFKPTHKLWVAGNHKPRIRGTDLGIWRRLRVVPFTVQIPVEDVDPTIPEQLRGELSGILNWAMRGCLDWQEHGLITPKAVREATEDYRTDEDIVGQFLQDQTQESPQLRVLKTALYGAYFKWCGEEGIKYPLSKNRLTSTLKQRGIKESSSDGKRYWRGLNLSEDQCN